MSLLIIRWPILNDHQTLASLKAEAREDLGVHLEAHGLRLQADPSWRVLHGRIAYLEAQAPVTEKYRLTGLPSFNTLDQYADWHQSTSTLAAAA